MRGYSKVGEMAEADLVHTCVLGAGGGAGG